MHLSTYMSINSSEVPIHGQLAPRLIQCGLGRGLLPYQVASSSTQTFGHNRHGPKIGWGWVCLFFCREQLGPHRTQSPRPRPTSIPSGILVHPAVWPQRTLAKNWGCAPLGEGSWVSIYHNVVWTNAHLHAKCHLDPCSRLATTDMGQKLGRGGGLCPFFEGGSWVPI